MEQRNTEAWLKGPRSRSFIVSAASLLLIAGIAYYLYANAKQYLELLKVSVPGVLTLLGLTLTFPIINGLINTHLFRSLGAEISHREGILLAASTSLVNQLPLPGGLLAKGIYLKHKYGLAYAQFFSASLALFFCNVAINGLIGTGVLLGSVFLRGEHVPHSLLLGFGLMALCIFIFRLPLPRAAVANGLLKWANQLLQGWRLISRSPSLLLKLLAFQTALMLLLAARYWAAFHMLSQAITWGQVVLLSCASVLTQLVSIAPGGLGVQEAIVGGTATALGFDLTVSLAAVELDRLVATFTIVVVGWIGTSLLGRDISKARRKSGQPRA